MDDEDEVDILGDFTLENLLTKNDNRIWSCYEGDNEYPSSNWLQESTSQCWQDDRTLCSYSSTSNLLMPSSSSTVGSPDKNDTWTDKECYLLDKGLELFGRSWSRLAQYIGSKTSQQVRARVKSGGGGAANGSGSYLAANGGGGSYLGATGGSYLAGGGGGSLLAGISTTDLSTCAVLDSQLTGFNCAELIDDMQIPASIEEVIATVTTAKPTVQSLTPRQRQNSGSGSTSSFLGSSHLSHGSSSVPPTKKSRGRPRKEESDRRGGGGGVGGGPKMVKRKEDRRRRGGKKRTKRSSSEEMLMNLLYALPDEQNSITLPSGEQVIRIQPNSQDDDDEEIDIEDGSDCGVLEQQEVTTVVDTTVDATVVDTTVDTTTVVVDDFQPETIVETKQQVPNVPLYTTTQSAMQSHQAAVMSKYMQTIQERLEKVYSLPAPTRELQLNLDIVSEEEMKLHPEFFAKSENFNRYLRIRSHIVNSWLETKPNYVTKTSVRFGLKNCGDVNLISRVHAYLEQKGYINFGCDQCHYLTVTSSQLKNQSNVGSTVAKQAEVSTSETGKPPAEIVKTTFETVKPTSETFITMSETTKTTSETVKSTSEPMKPATETVILTSEIVKTTSEPVKPPTVIVKPPEGVVVDSETVKPTSETVNLTSETVKTTSEPVKPPSEPLKPPSGVVVELNRKQQRLSGRKRVPCFRFRSQADERETSSRSLLIKRVVREPKAPTSHQVDLITCREFGDQNPEPFCLVMKGGALIVANLHGASNMQREVIGLLGGIYEQDARRLEIHVAVPCRSLAADRVTCEICPVSQSEASTSIEQRGLAVVGWYHTHPGFKPQPSAVDVRTQAAYQRQFGRDHSRPPFVALIVTPDQHLAADYNLVGGDCAGILFRIFFVLESGGEMIPYRLRPIIDSSNYSLESIMDSIKAIKQVN